MSVFIGDEDIQLTYAAVGQALTRWEAVELALAHLYSIFTGNGTQLETIRWYGANNRIFIDRLRAVKNAASGYFIKHSSQEDEGEFYLVAEKAEYYSHVRNNIAHGLVHAVTYLKDEQYQPIDVGRYMLLAPWYARDRISLSEEGSGSEEILAMSQPFIPLVHDIARLSERLIGRPISLPQISA